MRLALVLTITKGPSFTSLPLPCLPASVQTMLKIVENAIKYVQSNFKFSITKKNCFNEGSKLFLNVRVCLHFFIVWFKQAQSMPSLYMVNVGECSQAPYVRTYRATPEFENLWSLPNLSNRGSLLPG